MKKLTKSQQRVYDYLKEASTNGIPPTVREICAATGLSSTSTVHNHLKTLEKFGYINRTDGKNRAIQLRESTPTTYVPIIGSVAAGIPITAIEDHEGYVPYPSASGEDLFALHVKGLSMKDAGILDGDLVIAKKQPIAENGDIVVAMIDDEATVKTFYREPDRIRLQPENPDFDPIYTTDVVILGIVKSVQRFY
ncbi:MAG: transcriptional repressor LexA [Clostridia bacterium]|nr:transcriptional repressor LexA [Clostridia bacterium]